MCRRTDQSVQNAEIIENFKSARLGRGEGKKKGSIITDKLAAVSRSLSRGPVDFIGSGL